MLKKRIILILIILVIIFAVVFVYQWWRAKRELIKQGEENEWTEVSQKDDWKTYRNEEFGFEFQYPNNWEIKENTFGSPTSKFNLNVVPTKEKYLPDPILINIVTLDFADNVISNLEKLKENKVNIIVNGVNGTKYAYTFEGLGEVAIDLPFDGYHILIGAKKRYENVFNQVLSTLKFLK